MTIHSISIKSLKVLITYYYFVLFTRAFSFFNVELFPNLVDLAKAGEATGKWQKV